MMDKILKVLQNEGIEISSYNEERGTIAIPREYTDEGLGYHIYKILKACKGDLESENGMLVYNLHNVRTDESEVRLYKVDDSKFELLKDRDGFEGVDFSVLNITKALTEAGYEVLETFARKVVVGLGKDHTLYDLTIQLNDFFRSRGIDFDTMAKGSIRGIVELDGTSYVSIINIDDRMFNDN